VKEKEKPRLWFSEGIRFECQRCGKCCRGEPGIVRVTADEITRIAEHLNTPRERFVREKVRREGSGLCLMEFPNGDCILWKGECTAYECRPKQCRTFPFWKYALGGPAQLREVLRGCPGIDRGRLYTCEEILAIAAGRRDTSAGESDDS
jgi:Fe-S-cluster containining protein